MMGNPRAEKNHGQMTPTQTSQQSSIWPASHRPVVARKTSVNSFIQTRLLGLSTLQKPTPQILSACVCYTIRCSLTSLCNKSKYKKKNYEIYYVGKTEPELHLRLEITDNTYLKKWTFIDILRFYKLLRLQWRCTCLLETSHNLSSHFQNSITIVTIL